MKANKRNNNTHRPRRARQRPNPYSAVSQHVFLKIEIPIEVIAVDSSIRFRDTVRNVTYTGFIRVRDLLNYFISPYKAAFNYFKVTRMSMNLEKIVTDNRVTYISFTAEQVQSAESLESVSSLDNARRLPQVTGNKVKLTYSGLKYDNPVGVTADKFDGYPGGVLAATNGQLVEPVVAAIGTLDLFVKATGLKQ